MIAWMTVGSTWPTLSVPGICSSGTIFHARNIAVVVANEPMPSVSKKLVTNPIPVCSGVGMHRLVTAMLATRALAPRHRVPGDGVEHCDDDQRDDQGEFEVHKLG